MVAAQFLSKEKRSLADAGSMEDVPDEDEGDEEMESYEDPQGENEEDDEDGGNIEGEL